MQMKKFYSLRFHFWVMALLMGAGISVQVAEASSRVMRTEDVPTPVIRFAAGGASANCGQTVTMQVTNAVEGYYYCWYTAIPDAGNPTANLVGIGTELTIPEIFASATYYVIPVADLQLGTPVDFNYTGAAQTYIPTSSVMKLEVWGAQGGGTTYTPGMGGYSVGTLVFPEISPMYVYVGGRGVTASTSSANWAAGGFNGGGAVYSQSRAVGSGGGATDIRVGGSTLYHRIIVAGGGGGSGVNSGGNYGGGTNGGGNTARSSGTIQVYTSSGSAGCGTQTSGGNADVYQSSELANSAAATFGQGAVYYALHTNNTSTGGGGGGWYGGGVKNHQGGGGGSGFVWTAAALSTVQNLPGDFMIPTDYYLTDASTIAGNSSFMSPTGTSETGHSGDGFARITPYVPTAFAGNYAIQQITVSLNLPNPNNVMTSAQSEVECGNAIQLSANVEQGIIQWYASPEGNVLLGTTESGESLTIFPAVGNTTYYALAIASNGHCTSAQRVATSPVTVVPAAAPTIAGATISCGESVLLSVQNSEERYNYYWFTDAECTQLVHIGDTYLTPELNATQTYYVEARLAVDLDTTFAYTGTVQSFDIPDNVHELVLEVWGAQGGASTAHGTVGGNGGYAKGVYSVPDDVHTLYINVGGKGNTGSYAVNGGWNGGGGVTNEYYYGGAGNHLGTGGGATDIATVYSAVTLDDQYRFVRSQASYESRLIVAAGGGGAENANGGVGGGAQGGGVNPGTQSAAGANASWAEQWVNFYPAGFGYGISVSGGHTEHAMGACGGGGWYGGGCYDDNTTDALIAGAGGSGYVGSLASSILLAGDQEMPTPTGEGTMVGNSGNGYARIYAGPHCSSEATPVHVTVTELSAPTVENSSITAACSENVTLSASSSDGHTRIVWYEGDEMIGFGDENGELTLQPTVGTHHYYAESQRFIVDSTYYRFENMNGSITSTSGANSSYGYLFTPIEDIYVYKLRSYFGTKVTVYDANGNALAILPLNSSLNGSWQEVELERPLHLAANTNYYLAAYSGGRTVYYQTSAPSCQHASLTRRSATGDQYLTSSASYYYLVNMVYSTGLNDTTICQSPTRAEVTATITRYPAPRITMVPDLGCGEPLTLSVSNRPEHSRLAWYTDGGRTLLGYSSDDEFEVLPLADTSNYYATFVGDSPFDTLNLWNQYSTGFTTVSARDYTYGYSFIPSVDIVVTHLQSYFGSRITIWNSISEEVARVDYPSDLAHWTTVALDEPVVLTAGQTYTIGCYTNGLTSYYSAASAAAPTFRHGHLGSYYYGVNDVRPTSAGSGWYPVDFVYHLENDAEQAGCEPNFAMVSVSPQHPTEVEITNGTTRQSVCGEPVTMTHSALGDGDRVAWYDSATGGNLLGYSEDDQFTAVPTAAETHYFAENQRITVDTNASSLWGALGEASTSTTSTSYTYGYCIQPDTNITVYKLRHYFGMNVNIWNSNGGLLASAAYTSGQATAQSWSETALPVPVVLEKGAVYYIGAYSGGYAHYYQTAQAPYFPYGSIHATYNSGNGMPSSAAGTTTYYQNPMVDFVYGIGADTLICSSAARTEVTVVRQDLPAPTVSISEDAPSCGEEIVLHAAPLPGARIAWFNGSDTLGYSDGHGDLRIVPSIGETTYSAEYQSDYISHAQYTLWDVSATPQGVSQNAYTFGYRFTPNEDITVSAFRHTFGRYISLWEQSSNYLVARKEVLEAGGLWQTTALDTPITLISGMTYVLSAYQPSGASYFGSPGYHPSMAHGTLTASTSNMWYSSGDGYPNSTSSSYPYPLIDIVYSVPGGTTMPCPASQRSSVDVEVASPSGPVVADYPELSCGDNCTLQVENASPDKVYYWYDDSACTNLVNEGPVFVTPYLDGDVTYYVVSENIMDIDTAFRYTGGERTFVVPEGIDRLTLQVWGAQGGTGWYSASTSRLGGKGGYAQGTLAVSPGDVLYINVGGKGQDATSSALADSSSFAGGYNGGGRSGAHQYAVVGQGGGGGGATHIAKVSGVLSTLTENKNDVLIVAGGGGGGSYNAIGGAGGGASGISSNASGGSSSAGGNGYNGSAYYGGMKGLFGQGGCGASYPGRTGGGGGGGGWYGGGGGSTYSSNSNATNYSGGGGSGYVSSQLSSTQNIAGNASLPDTVSGNVTGRVGDGYARITASGLGCRSLATAVPIVVNQYATPDITSLSPSVTCGEEAVLTTELPGEGAQVAWYDAHDNLLGYATNATDHTTFSVLPRSGSETYYEKIVRYSYSADDLTIMGTPETVPSTYSYGYPYTYGYSFTPNTAITVYELRSHFGSKVSLWQGSTLMATAQLEGGNADWQNVALDHPVTLAAGTTCYVGAYANGTKYKYYPTAPTFANGSLGGYYYSNGDTRPVSYTAAGWPLVDIVYSVAELDTTVCQSPPQSVTVTMTGLPAPTVSTQSQTIACGSSLSLQASSTIPDSQIVWFSGEDEQPIGYGGSLTVNPDEATTYYAELQRSVEAASGHRFYDHTPICDSLNNSSYYYYTFGYRITPSQDIRLTKLYRFFGSTIVVYDASNNIIYRENCSSYPRGQWTEIPVCEDVVLQANTNYYLGAYMGGERYLYYTTSYTPRFGHGTMLQTYASGNSYPTSSTSTNTWQNVPVGFGYVVLDEAADVFSCAPARSQGVEIALSAVQAPAVEAPAPITCGNTTTLEIADPQAGMTYLWYDDEECTHQVGEGSTFTTPTLSSTTAYYVKSAVLNDVDQTYDAPGVQTYVVPQGVRELHLQVWGAQGGNGTGSSATVVSTGGHGGYAEGILQVTPGEKLHVYVGGQGESSPGTLSQYMLRGGFNGGADAGVHNSTSYTYQGGAGGGATDIRLNDTSLYSRIIVAGGGGGAGSNTAYVGGQGGGVTGGNAASSYAGYGGTATAGGTAASSSYTSDRGSFGRGGNGVTYPSYCGSGGGGGGWYGGSGGALNGSTGCGGGGAGSGFVWKNGASVPAGYRIGPERYLNAARTVPATASSAVMPNTNEGGGNISGRTGNGFARISGHGIGCLSGPTEVEVVVNEVGMPVPTNDAAELTVSCGESVFLNTTSEPNTRVAWYDAPENGNLLGYASIIEDEGDAGIVTRFEVVPSDDTTYYYAESQRITIDTAMRNAFFENSPCFEETYGPNSYTYGYRIVPDDTLIVYGLRSCFGTKVSLWNSYGQILAAENLETNQNGTWQEAALDVPVVLMPNQTYYLGAYSGGLTSFRNLTAPTWQDGTLTNLYSTSNSYPTSSSSAYYLVDFVYGYDFGDTTCCTSSERTEVAVTVNSLEAPVILNDTENPESLTIECGEEVVLTTSSAPQYRIAWFDAAENGNLLGYSTDNSFRVSPDFSTTYYAETQMTTIRHDTTATANMLGDYGHTSSSGTSSNTYGFRFTPDVDVWVTKVRHYFGTKVSVWDANGTLVGSQTVANAYGNWNETSLDAPFALRAGQTYTVGCYAGGSYYYTNGTPLTRFANGTIDGYYYYSGNGFPNSSTSNYVLVDLIYSVTSADTVVCNSPERSPVGIVVGDIEDPTADDVEIDCGQTATLHVNAPNPLMTYYWYDSRECDSVIHQGETFTTPLLNDNTTYYVKSAKYEVDTMDFHYTGTEQVYDIPAGTSELKLAVWGAQGGNSTYHGTTGGKGGYAEGTYIVPDNVNRLYVYVGGQGTTGSQAVYGGWNGGGGVTNAANYLGTYNHNGTGGGATDIATQRSDVTDDGNYRYVRTDASYRSRIIVAGGGGGAESSNGGVGGGLTGGGAYPGTQAAAGGHSTNASSYVAYYPAGFGYGISVSCGHTNHAMGACGGGGWYGGGCSDGNGYGCGGSAYSGNLSDARLLSGSETMPDTVAPNTTVGRAGNGFARVIAMINRCESNPIAVNVTVNSLSVPTVTSPGTTLNCGDTAELTAETAVTDGVVAWYTEAEGGAPFAYGSAVQVSPDTTTTYYAETRREEVTSRLSEDSYDVYGSLGYYSTTSGYYTMGYDFVPDVDVQVEKFRHYYGTYACIWDSEGGLLAGESISSSNGTWKETPLSAPVTLLAGRTYRIGVYAGGYSSPFYYRSTPQTEFGHGSIGSYYYNNGTSSTTARPTATTTVYAMIDFVYNTYEYDTLLCTSTGTRPSVTVNVEGTPAPTAETPEAVYCGQAQTLRVDAVEGCTYYWYDESDSLVHVGESYTTPLLHANTTYRVRAAHAFADTLEYSYTGDVQRFVVPTGTDSVSMQVWGAQGGTYSSYAGGKGGYAEGRVKVAPLQTLYVYVGGTTTTVAGGYNGGGNGMTNGKGGGGSTDIRTVSGDTRSRLLVAGGGGGAGVSYGGGYGGGLNGGNGYTSSNRNGFGGSQTGGGTTWNSMTSHYGSFGQGGSSTSGYSVGGGGGGWYGGGAGYDNDSDSDGRGGGGGSGYVYTAATASSYPSGCLLDGGDYLSDARTVAGNAAMPNPQGGADITGNTGDGHARIIYNGVRCFSPATEVEVEVLELPAPTVENSSITAACSENVTLSASSSDGHTRIVWYEGDEMIGFGDENGELTLQPTVGTHHYYAESQRFIVDSTYYRFENMNGSITSTSGANSSYGYLFTPIEDIYVYKLRSYFGTKVTVYDANGNALAILPLNSSLNGSWQEVELERPLHLAANTNYYLAAYSGGRTVYYQTSAPSCQHASLTRRSATGDQYLTSSASYYYLVNMVYSTGLNDTTICQSPTRAEVTATITRYPAPRITMVPDLGCGEPLTLSVSNRPEHSRLAWYTDGGRTLLGYSSDDEFEVLPLADTSNYYATFVGDSPFDTLNLWNQYSTGFTTVSARDYTYGYSFIPSVDIVVTHLQSYFGSRITIWNSISEEVARVDYPSDLAHWTTVALDEPVVLTAGQTYTIGCYTNGLTSYYSAASAAAPTFRHGHLGSYYYGVNDVRPTSAGSGWYPVDFVYHLENDAEQAGCEPNFAMVSVSPQHPTEVEITNGTTRQSVCGEPVTMTHSALGDGDRVAWYDSATGGNLLGYSEDDQFTAVPTAAETHYFAENQRITVDTNASSLWGALGEASTSTTSTSYTYGYCIQPDTNITVYKLRHYFGMNVNIWNSNGGLLASAAYTSGQATAQSWSETALPVPVVLEKGAVYYIGAYSGGYAHYYQTAQAPYFPYGSIHATYNSGNGMPSSAAGTTTYYQNPMVDFVYGIGADTLICSSAARTEVTVVRQDLPAPTVSISEDAPSCGEEIVLHAAPLPGARIAWFNGSDTLGYSDGHGDLRIVPSIGETTYSAEYQSDYISHAQYTLWDVSATPQGVSQNAYTFGYRFTPNEDITVSAFRHTFGRYISLWEQSSNYLVARKEVLEAGGLWQTTALDTPITLISGMTYVLSAYQPSGASYFGSPGYHPSMAHGTLTASTSNMWYSSGDGYPNSTSSSYPYPLIDIVYSVPGGTTMPCPASQRSSVDVEVASPSGPVVADYPELSCGDNCTLQVENASPDKVYYWYDDSACTNLVNEGPVFVTPYLDGDVTYYVVSENIMDIDTAFRYTGGERTFVVPEGIDRLTLQVWGAQGGTGWYSASTSRLGGKGGYAQGTLAVSPGDVLYINVGGKGQDATSSALADSSSFAGGYNGGGRSGAHQYAVVGQGGGGGGATHIAKVSGVLSTLTENKNDVLIVAGGGGGGSYNAIGGAGGGASGISSNASGGSSSAGGNGYNGSAYYGGMKGLFGQGGCGASYPGRTGGGGGGGGWYGGGGGSTYSSNSNATNYSGGGGSGYVSSQLSSTQNIAGNASLPDTVSGNVTGRVGDGYARITASGLGCRSLATAVPIVVNQYATPDITSLSPSVTCGEEAVLTTELPGEGAQVAWYDAHDNLLGYATNATDHTTFSVLPRSGSETYYEKIVRYSYSADDLTIMGTPETVPSTYSYGYPYTYGYSFTPNTAITVYELRSHFGSKVSLWQGSTLMATAQLEGGNADWQNVALDHPVTLAAGTTCYVGAYANGTKYKYYPTAPTFANGSLGGYYYSNGDTRPVSYTAAGWPLVDIVYSVAELDTTVCQSPPQSVTVTMTGLPAPTVSTQSQTIACGSSLSLQASSTIPDSQIVWFSGEDEQPIGYGGSLTVNPDEATTYYAELQRSVEAASGHRFYDHTPICDSLNNSSYYYYTFGYRITPSQDIRLTKLYRFFGSTIVVYDASNNIIYRENCSSYPRGQWTEIPVCEDVVLQANTNYYLGAYMGGERYLYYTTSYTPRFGHGTMLQTYASGNSYPTSSTSTNTWQNVPVGFGYVVLDEAADVFSCAPARSQGVEIALSAVQAPAVEAPAPITCGNTTTLEIADPQAGMTYLWYDDEECTHQVGEGSTFTTPTLSSTTAYYVKSAVLNDVDQTYDAPGVQTYVVPQGVRELHLQVWGAQGGNGTGSSATVVSTGGHGGYAEGILQVTPGEKLHVYVGGQGESSPGTLSQYMLRGGFNGGADAGVHNSTSYTYQGGAGGGATDIRLNDTSLYSRIIVAGGGGGAGSNTAYVGGQGGGVTGGNAASSYAGYGGTATAGGTAASSSYTSDRGSFGRGGNGVTYPSYCGSGGGGGGWYGGSGGALNGSTGCGGGGAGSGFVWKNGASVPAGYRIGPERYLNAARTVPATASSAVMPNTNEGGGNISGRTGNGFARISGHGIGCLSGPTEVEVVVNEVGMPVPTNDAAELTVSCGESVFLNTTSEPNTRVAWYDAPENGNLLGYASIIEDEGDAGIVTRFEVVPSDDTTYYYAESQRITIDTAMRNAFFENSPCFEETYGPNSYTYGYRIVPDDTLIVYGLRSCFGTKVSLWNSYGQILAAENLETNQNGTWQEAALDVPVVLMPNQTYYLGAYSGGLTSFRNLTAPTWQDGTLTNLYSTSNSYPTSSSSAYYLVDFVYGYDFGDTTCCTSSERTEVAVTVNSLEAPVILNDTENPESLTIECGEEVVLTTSSAPQYRIAWFDAAENGNLLGYSTDNSFRVSPDFSTTYYAETQMTTIRHDTTATANMLGDYGHTSSSGTSSNTYGFRFTPDVDVWVTKVRHYFGTKVSVWDANGTLVGSQTVANAYGNWNETSLDAPFALRAGQTYTVGCYAGGSYYYTNGTPLTRFANGTIDGYYYYSGNGFPNSSTSNYVLVDLIYSVTSADTVVCNSPERSPVGIVVGDIEDPTADDVGCIGEVVFVENVLCVLKFVFVQ